jgi:hypothetical protein
MYLKSGHLPYYKDSMFPAMELDGERYYLKAMNCPHHHKIFGALPRSYKELPIRLAEYGTCYRYEQSGELFGLMRVRSLQMNDAHIYCTEAQFEQEFRSVNELYLRYFEVFGIEKYRMRFSKHDPAKLGQKYINNPELWEVNNRRNIPFELMSKLNFDGIEFFSLQKGEGAKGEIKSHIKQLWKTNNFHDYTEELKDFSDTAALISQLDLVISVDTSTAHLAGALGKPVWILNRYDSCWRWLSKIETSDWYPSAKLLRQKNPGDWSDVIDSAKNHLSTMFLR